MPRKWWEKWRKEQLLDVRHITVLVDRNDSRQSRHLGAGDVPTLTPHCHHYDVEASWRLSQYKISLYNRTLCHGMSHWNITSLFRGCQNISLIFDQTLNCLSRIEQEQQRLTIPRNKHTLWFNKIQNNWKFGVRKTFYLKSNSSVTRKWPLNDETLVVNIVIKHEKCLCLRQLLFSGIALPIRRRTYDLYAPKQTAERDVIRCHRSLQKEDVEPWFRSDK